MTLSEDLFGWTESGEQEENYDKHDFDCSGFCDCRLACKNKLKFNVNLYLLD